MSAARRGGKLYGVVRLMKLKNYLDRREVILVIDDPTMKRLKMAGFKGSTRTLFLPSDATQYEVWHELAHVIQYLRLGSERYAALQRPAVPEQFAYDLLRKNVHGRWLNRLNLRERVDASLKIEQSGGIAW